MAVGQMNPWIDRILKEFPADLSRLWIAADPDDVLLDEQVLAGLRSTHISDLPWDYRSSLFQWGIGSVDACR